MGFHAEQDAVGISSNAVDSMAVRYTVEGKCFLDTHFKLLSVKYFCYAILFDSDDGMV